MLLKRKAEEDVEQAVDLAGMCMALHVLPRHGGLLDQDGYIAYLLRAGVYGINKLDAQNQKQQS